MGWDCVSEMLSPDIFSPPSAVRGRQLTAWAMTQPFNMYYYEMLTEGFSWAVLFSDGSLWPASIHVDVKAQKHDQLCGTSQLRLRLPGNRSSWTQYCSPSTRHHAGLRGFRCHPGQGDTRLRWVSSSSNFVSYCWNSYIALGLQDSCERREMSSPKTQLITRPALWWFEVIFLPWLHQMFMSLCGVTHLFYVYPSVKSPTEPCRRPERSGYFRFSMSLITVKN